MSETNAQSNAEQDRPSHLLTQFEALEKLIRSHLEDHQQLLVLIREKREHVRHADLNAIVGVTEREKELIARISQVEHHRTTLVKRLTLAIDQNATEPMTVTELAESLGETPVATRLLALAGQLREVALEVRRESSIVRQAADALSRHLSGVMQQVQAAISRVRVYGRNGSIEVGRQTAYSVDLKS